MQTCDVMPGSLCVMNLFIELKSHYVFYSAGMGPIKVRVRVEPENPIGTPTRFSTSILVPLRTQANPLIGLLPISMNIV